MRRLRRLSFFLLGFERGGNHDKVGGEGSVFRLHVSKILVMGQSKWIHQSNIKNNLGVPAH
jgi:hypothetical protein